MKNLIIAHCGASKYAPENTLPAFQLAYEMKAEGIETDVQLTKDNVPILIHDEQLQRTTKTKGLVKNYTFKQIKQMDAGRYFSGEYAGTTILSLDEFLEWSSDKALYLNLELKNNKIDYEGIEEIVLEAIEKYKVKDRTTISSFSSASVKRMRQLDKDLDIALLRSRKHVNLAAYASELGASSLHIKHTLLNDSLMRACRQLNLPVRVYTVNHRASIYRSLRFKCEGLITDVPDRALKLRKRFSEKHI